MTALFLATALAVQQPDLRDAASVTRLLASLRSADPAVCELAGRSLTNVGGWNLGDGDDPVRTPMPMPMPVPMPMPFAERGLNVSGPGFGSRMDRTWTPAALAAFRTALRDPSRCVRRLAARVVAQARPAWASAEFAALAKDADPGRRETGMLGLDELEDPKTITTMTAGLSDRDAGVRAMAAWALGEIESARAVPLLRVALGDADWETRRTAVWALGRSKIRRRSMFWRRS